jgi:hypothetical protein
LVPIVNGGVNLLKLRSLMHDTCNTANATAREIARLVEEKGREYYGDEEWDDLPEEEKCILDFLCGNHTRGLPVDAFNRRFEDWLAEELSAEFDAAAGESGGRARLEKSGTSLLRSLFKLIHSGWGAYEKVRLKYLLVLVAHVSCLRSRFSHKKSPASCVRREMGTSSETNCVIPITHSLITYLAGASCPRDRTGVWRQQPMLSPSLRRC